MKEKLPFLIYMAVGAVLMAVSLAIRSDYYSNLVFWMGFGTLVAEGVHLARQMWWQAPSRQAAYQAKRRQDHIDAVDERKQMLRMRSTAGCSGDAAGAGRAVAGQSRRQRPGLCLHWAGLRAVRPWHRGAGGPLVDAK